MITIKGLGSTGHLKNLVNRSAANRTETSGRMASGLRINRAADDSAGLAVAEQLDTTSRSKRAAIRNLQDGLSALDIAEGGLKSIGENVKRLRELAVQSASEVLHDTERAYVQIEYSEMMQEINATANKTKFADRSLLARDSVDVGFMIDTSTTMFHEIDEVSKTIQAFKDTLSAGNLDVGMGLVEANSSADSGDGTSRLADIDAGTFDSALASLSTQTGFVDPWAAMNNASGVNDTTGTDEPDTLSWRESSKRKVLIWVSDTFREVDMIPGFETQTSVANGLASAGFEVHTINNLSFSSDYSTITSTTGGKNWDIGDGTGSDIPDALKGIASTLAANYGDDGIVVQAGDGSGDEHRIALDLPVSATTFGLGINGTKVGTREDALDALEKLEGAMDLVNQARSTVGSHQNRLNSALNSETVAEGHTSGAETKIRNADFAQQASYMAKEQILADAATAILAQAGSIGSDAVRSLIQ